MKTLKIKGWEYETETHDFNKKLSEIKIPKGWQLWDVSDFRYFGEKEFNKLNLWNDWFFIKQPMKVMEEKGYASWFLADSGWTNFFCLRVPTITNSLLGVRFKRRIK